MHNLRQIIREHISSLNEEYALEPDDLVGNNPESTDQLIDNIIGHFHELKGQDLEPYKNMLKNMFRTIRQIDPAGGDLGLVDEG